MVRNTGKVDKVTPGCPRQSNREKTRLDIKGTSLNGNEINKNLRIRSGKKHRYSKVDNVTPGCPRQSNREKTKLDIKGMGNLIVLRYYMSRLHKR